MLNLVRLIARRPEVTGDTDTLRRGRPPQVIDDTQAAAILARRAFVEIRSLAGNRPSWNRASEENLDCIRFLADMCHNMPGPAPKRGLRRTWSEQRPMSWTWNTTGPQGQALMLKWIEEAGYSWTPPPKIDS
jgi:hypothetical protein